MALVDVKKLGNEVTACPEKVIKILARDTADKSVAVVSAVTGLTDLFLSYVNGNVSKESLLDKFLSLYSPYGEYGIEIKVHYDRLKETLKKIDVYGIAFFISMGEKISADIINELMRSIDIRSCAVYPEDIKFYGTGLNTHMRINKNIFEFIKNNIQNFLNKYDLIIVPGFYAINEVDGKNILLGRGGSDFTASIIAEAIKPSSITFYKEVGGVYSIDPDIGGGKILKKISMSNLDNFSKCTGRMFYPFTFSVLNSNHPDIVIRNSTGRSGTSVVDGADPFNSAILSLGFADPPDIVIGTEDILFEIPERSEDRNTIYITGDFIERFRGYMESLSNFLLEQGIKNDLSDIKNGFRIKTDSSSREIIRLVRRFNSSYKSPIIR